MTDQPDAKTELRARMRQLRAAIAFAERDRASRALAEAFMAAIKLKKGEIVGAYANQGAEMSLWPLVEQLHRAGVKLALPVVVAPDKPLVFRAWKPGDALARGPHGNPEPVKSAKAVKPTLLLVPLLAFDDGLHRLGQGGGYYDRTLAALRKAKKGKLRAIGIAFTAQRIEQVPRAKHDQKLDAVVTEAGLLE